MYKGGAGGYSFYVRGGEQVVRQRKNNSNYGDTASRTYAQMRRRVMWANLVNFYKANKFWMPKAFELRSGGQTDYNRFMQLNIPFSEHALTKEQALLGVCAPFTMQVSEGSLPAIQYDNGAEVPFVTDIKLTQNWTTSGGTVAQLSADIINNNPRWQNGDNLAIVRVEMAPYDGNPYIIPHYYEFTLNTADTTTQLSSLEVFTQSGATFNGPYVSYPLTTPNNQKYGFVMIHTRKQGGQLLVSTQELICLQDDYYYLTEPQHVDEAINSYGVDAQVPLDPGSGGGSVTPGGSTYASFVLTGAGTDLVSSPTFSLEPGRYRVTANPSTWGITSISGNVTILAIGGNIDGSTYVNIYNLTTDDFEETGVPSNLNIDIPANIQDLRFAIRADSGVHVVVSARKI